MRDTGNRDSEGPPAPGPCSRCRREAVPCTELGAAAASADTSAPGREGAGGRVRAVGTVLTRAADRAPRRGTLRLGQAQGWRREILLEEPKVPRRGPRARPGGRAGVRPCVLGSRSLPSGSVCKAARTSVHTVRVGLQGLGPSRWPTHSEAGAPIPPRSGQLVPSLPS